MGYVETAQTDIVRDSLIGIAPLIAGSLFIAYAGLNRMGLSTLLTVLANGQTELFWTGLKLLPQVNDFFLWFYLAFTVSSTMMPSESDRHAWLPLGLWTAGLLTLAIFAGAGTWMLENITPLLNAFSRLSSHLVWIKRCPAYHTFIADNASSSHCFKSHRGGC